MKFIEEQLELAIMELFKAINIPHINGTDIVRNEDEVLIKEDIASFLKQKYSLTQNEIQRIISDLEAFSTADIYSSNKLFMEKLSDGFIFERDDNKDNIFIELIEFSNKDNNIYKIVTQFEIIGSEKRRPDAIFFVNGMPLVVFEFKSAIREEATIFDAYTQITTRYRRDIPSLFIYNAFCVISDGVNSKAGSFFAPYEFYYAWRKVNGNERIDEEGINSLYTLINGIFDKARFSDIIKNFIYLPDTSKREDKVFCRYPQYYAANKLFENIKAQQKPHGSGKGGIYFGATGCGKSYTMLFLTRLLMKSLELANPTIILISDRIDLDDQLSAQFINAKAFIGDEQIVSVKSRADLRTHLSNKPSGGVFLTTIHKFNEDTQVLTDRTNVICISDEAHRSQINLDQKVITNEKGTFIKYGFAKHLHNSLPNATYVGFTGTPIDKSLEVFGDIVDIYTMNESVFDEITVRIVYEGRAAKVILDNSKLQEIEKYYEECEESGANEHQIEESKKQSSTMSHILGDPDRIRAIANDFVNHYEARLSEGASVMGKALFVSSRREIAYSLYKELQKIRPEWFEIKLADNEEALTDNQKKELKPIEKVKMVMTRGKDDPKEMYDLLGTSEYKKELDRQFKNVNSNFKIAIIVDMWLTGFDVPCLDTIYIDKPIQRHSLIQTISRVNRKFEDKEKGLVVDYIGIKKQMNIALASYSGGKNRNMEEIEQSVVVVKDHLDLLNKIFHKFDTKDYLHGSPLERLECLKKASEFVQASKELETRFMNIVKRVKMAYDICCGSEDFTQIEKDLIHFYCAVRAIIYKLTKGDAPDISQMNARVRAMIEEALLSDGVEEIYKLGEDSAGTVDIFSDDYMQKIAKIKLPNTKIKLLQKLLTKALDDFKKTNKVMGVDFSKKFKAIVDKYNERKEADVLRSEVLEEFTDEIIDLYNELRSEKDSYKELGIDIEEKSFYDILKALANKYDFEYPEDKLLVLAKEVKIIVDDKAKYTDWNKKENIKAELKVALILLLAKYDYPPVDKDEVYKEIFEQAENFKKYSG